MDENVQHQRDLRELWQQMHAELHQLEKEARLAAKKEVDARLEEMNKFREQIAQERGEFMRREMYDQQHSELREALHARINTVNDTVDTRLKLLENNRANLEGRLWMIGAGIGVLVTAIQLVVHYAAK